jgi:hypothetical protein
VTALEAYELTTKGGATDFAHVISACELSGPYCLIGGLAVNCYVEPVYTLDADIVVIAEHLPSVLADLEGAGFAIEPHENSVNAKTRTSDLRIQFTTDPRYQPFPLRSEEREIFGLPVKVACLEDLVRGKLWAYTDPPPRLSKRKKDELDLFRLAESYAEVRALLPDDLRNQLKKA